MAFYEKIDTEKRARPIEAGGLISIINSDSENCIN